ncbi:metal ABC transporter permease [Thiomicrospira cyclica]|jgi:zinc transport system permease protein|uniref:High-affinity zinc uptake system membrane protein ZnuB n=1 Tax=Thiomicrospira cyclica (strain DSM 14477 / JCM 11371 / ALM1) TaxID=717773 RepID=F6D9L0_THICA|nr:metal ABC transporter permease [Thiomicrospira cyclica]AEG30967.1 ABC-type transporter, integral membrane subunit [Thiomicrospira cyclica ALM1]
MLDYFIWLALLGGLLTAWIAAPLGLFVVWQRQAYFGETLAHSALLGVGIGLMLSINLSLAILMTSFLLVISLHFLRRHTQLANDTLLGILAHGSLASGLVLVALQAQVNIDIMSFLFGDILNLTLYDLLLMLGIAGLVTLFLTTQWHKLINLTLNTDLAQVEGVAVSRLQLQMTLLLALVIAMSMKVVGILLITSLLILPAATARRWAHSPEQMLVFAVILASLAILLGLGLSWYIDVPTGPAIVVCALGLFLLTLLLQTIRPRAT